MSLGRDSLLLWPMALLFLCFRLVTSALSRAAHRGLSKGQVFSQECLLIAGAPPSISGHYPRLSGARLISSHLTAGRQVPTDSSQTSRKSAAIDTKHIRLRQSSQFISKWLVKGEIFWIQGVPHPTSKRDSALIEMAIIAVFASDTCPGMICSSCSLRHQSHKSLRRTRVQRGDVISHSALIRNALALIFQQRHWQQRAALGYQMHWTIRVPARTNKSLKPNTTEEERIILWFLRNPSMHWCSEYTLSHDHSRLWACSVSMNTATMVIWYRADVLYFKA